MIIKYKSPFNGVERDLLIKEPKKVDESTPVFFIYDGHVLNEGVENFNTPDGIPFTKILNNVVLISLASVNEDEENKWDVRSKQLTHTVDNLYTWNNLVKSIVLPLKKKYKGLWTGVGFSLSGILVYENSDLFDSVIAISPAVKLMTEIKNKAGYIFHGDSWYPEKQRIENREALKILKKNNPKIKFELIDQMGHDFKYWRNEFPYIISQVFGRNGYLNEVRKVGDYYVRKPLEKFSNWENEQAIYKKLKIETEIDNDGLLKRKWIEGRTVDVWTKEKIESLKNEIEKFHKIDPENISKHNWDVYLSNIEEAPFSIGDFIEVRNSLNIKELVVSHNDINKLNVIWDNKQIHLIDFEWANLNHPLFDYVQFYITEKIMLIDRSNEFNKLLKLSLMYFILWTYEAPKSEFVTNLQKEYIKMLKKMP